MAATCRLSNLLHAHPPTEVGHQPCRARGHVLQHRNRPVQADAKYGANVGRQLQPFRFRKLKQQLKPHKWRRRRILRRRLATPWLTLYVFALEREIGTYSGTNRGHLPFSARAAQCLAKPILVTPTSSFTRATTGSPWVVPVKLRPLIRSTRLKRALGTKSLIAANELKKPVVAEFKARIRNAGGGRSEGSQDPSLEEAVEWARMLFGRSGEQRSACRSDPS